MLLDKWKLKFESKRWIAKITIIHLYGDMNIYAKTFNRSSVDVETYHWKPQMWVMCWSKRKSEGITVIRIHPLGTMNNTCCCPSCGNSILLLEKSGNQHYHLSSGEREQSTVVDQPANSTPPQKKKKKKSIQWNEPLLLALVVMHCLVISCDNMR